MRIQGSRISGIFEVLYGVAKCQNVFFRYANIKRKTRKGGKSDLEITLIFFVSLRFPTKCFTETIMFSLLLKSIRNN